MIKKFYIERKQVILYCTNTNKNKLPVIVLNTYGDESEKVFNECVKLKCNDFVLVAVSAANRDHETDSFSASKLYNGDNDFFDKADEYIKLLETEITPATREYLASELKIQISYLGIAGYSLGGLLAVYSAYKTSLFTRIVSASGSFWYPKFKDFIRENKTVSETEKIYFSLGNKESKAKNKTFSSVEANTKEIEQFYKEKGVTTIFELNKGNHFQNIEWRIAKGIKWILE